MGFIVEDFEDLIIVFGLIVLGGEFGFSSQLIFLNIVWDGISYYVDWVQVVLIVFIVVGGVSLFVFGLGDVDVVNVNLFVNGQDYGLVLDLFNWMKLFDDFCEVYVCVDVMLGEVIILVEIWQLVGGFNDGIFIDCVVFRLVIWFIEIVIMGDVDILNDGFFIVVNDLGVFLVVVIVNGVFFGVDFIGFVFGEWLVSGVNSFLFDVFLLELDGLFDDLIFVVFGCVIVDLMFIVGGLVLGCMYWLQMLFFNDVNSIVDNVEVMVEGVIWVLDVWQLSLINLIVEFIVIGLFVDVVMIGVVGFMLEFG